MRTFLPKALDSCAVRAYRAYMTWTQEEIDAFEARALCPRCGDPLPGDTDVVIEGKRCCSDCGYKAGVTEEFAS